jgi:hypothetical protein
MEPITKGFEIFRSRFEGRRVAIDSQYLAFRQSFQEFPSMASTTQRSVDETVPTIFCQQANRFFQEN